MPYTFNNNFLKTYNLHSRLQIYEVILKFKFFFLYKFRKISYTLRRVS